MSDHLPGRLKSVLLLALLLSSIGFIGFALVAMRLVPGGALVLLTACMTGGLFVNAVMPLGFELAAETTYGVLPEAWTSGFLTFVNTLVQVCFLAVPESSSSSQWMNITNACASPVAAAILLLLVAKYPRLVAEAGCAGGT